MKHMVKEYGATAVVIYVSLWAAPAGITYQLALANDNWGVDPMALLDRVGMKESVLGLLQLPLDTVLDPWQTSVVLAVCAADALELARVPATLYLAPKVKRALAR